MALVLYYAPQSRAVRVLWALEELGVPYEKISVDLSSGDQKKPEFLAMNPNGKVPTLVVDGTPMFESMAIVLYLGERFGVEKGLWPKADDLLRAEALAWAVWDSVTLASDASRLIYSSSDYVPKEQHNAHAASAGRADFETDLGILEGRLRGRTYVLGDKFSFVDLGLAHTINFLVFALKLDLTPWKHVAAWLERAKARPAFTRALSA